MDEGSGYCGSGGGIESVSDSAKIANVIMTGVKGDEICFEKDSVGRERGLTILQIC